MKKVAALGMVVAMSAALCFTTYADNSNNTTAVNKSIRIKQGTVTITSPNAVKPETKTIKGAVKEINDFGIKVIAEDGKVYVVPTGMIADTAEYESLKLKVDDKITVEGLDFEKIKVSKEISFTLDENDVASKDIIYIREAVPAIKAVRIEAGGNLIQKVEKADGIKLDVNEFIFPAEKITANGVTIELEKLMTKFAETQAIKIETKTVKGTVKEINDFGIKMNSEDNKVYVIPTSIFAETEDFKSMNLKVGDSITVEGPDFEKMMGKIENQKGSVFFTAPAIASAKVEFKDLQENASTNGQEIIVKKLDKAEMFKLDKDDIMFHAEKISANGVTIDIQKLMMEFQKPFQIHLKPNN